MTNKPNIIYIVAHDLGRMLNCYNRGFASPNLDRFAGEGALFNSAFCTTTACSPSRGCAWTGHYAHTSGLMGLVNRGWSLPVDRQTIVDHMNSAGVCDRCGGEVKIVAAVTDAGSIRKYLEGVGLPARAPPIAPARPHPQHEFDMDYPATAA